MLCGSDTTMLCCKNQVNPETVRQSINMTTKISVQPECVLHKTYGRYVARFEACETDGENTRGKQFPGVIPSARVTRSQSKQLAEATSIDAPSNPNDPKAEPPPEDIDLPGDL